MSFISILGAVLPVWVTTSFPIIKYILLAYIGLAAIAITVLVLLQPSNSHGGLNAITGATETYYSHNKGATREGRMKRATMWLAITVAIATLLYFVLELILKLNVAGA